MPEHSGKTFLSILGVMAAKLLGMTLSFLISVGIANQFGATGTTDSYFFARRIITNLAMVLERTFQLLQVPPLVLEARTKGLAALRANLSRRNLIIFGAMIPPVALAFIQAEAIVRLLAPGFDEAAIARTIPYFRILVMSLPISAVTALSIAVLNSLRVFGKPVLAGLVPRVCVLVALLLTPLGFGMELVAWGVLTGTVLSFVIFILLVRQGFRRAAQDSPVPPAPADALPRYTRYRILAMLLAQGHVLGASWIDMAFASTTGQGGVAMLEFAQRLVNVAPGVMASGVVVVYYTEFARALAEGDYQTFRENLRDCTRFSLFLTVPIAVTLLILNAPIVAIVLEHGAFSPEAATQTAMIVSVLACMLPVIALLGSVTSAIFADPTLPHVRIIGLASGTALAVRVGLDLWLVPDMGIRAVPLASLSAMSVLLVLLYGALNRKIGRLLCAADLKPIAGIVLASLGAGLTIHLVFAELQVITGNKATLLVLVLLAGLCGGLVYLLLGRLLRLSEATRTLGYLGKILGKLRK